MKIVYFTSTGNCLAAAKRIGREGDAELLSIPQLQKEGRYEIADEEAVGIVFPVYGFALPLLVKRYIERCRISSPYTFVVATYGNIAGAALTQMRSALARGGNKADYYETLLTVDNYLPGYEVGDQVSRLPEKGTEDALERIAGDIAARAKREPRDGLGIRAVTAAMAVVQEPATTGRARKWFAVNDDCIGCGICARICPVSNVVQEGKGKPAFGGACESCFACVHNCPKVAIHLKNEKSAARWRNPDVTVKEIIAANEQ